MSNFHSESKNDNLQFTVRVKFLSLNHALPPLENSSRNETAEERLGALLVPGVKRQRQGGSDEEPVETKPERRQTSPSLPSAAKSELCMEGHGKQVEGEFEEHIETCTVCSNRVELQLDFMECLESAVYQRLSEPKSARVHGALMVSAPKLNFAICGELEVG